MDVHEEEIKVKAAQGLGYKYAQDVSRELRPLGR